MPIAPATQNLRLATAWQRFRETSTTSLNLQKHPAFPEFLWRVEPSREDGEDYLSGLFRQAFSGRAVTSDDSGSADSLLLRSAKGRRHRTALFRVRTAVGQTRVVQVADLSPTPQKTSCLGRIGIIDILIARLSEVLQIGRDNPITMTELVGVGFHGEAPESKLKLLGRLNEGHFVTEATIRRFAKAFDLNPMDLCFDHPGIYSPSRQRDRAQFVETRNWDELLNHPIHLEVLDPLNPELLHKIRVHRQEGGEIKYEEFKPYSTDPPDRRRSQSTAVILFCNAFDAGLRLGGSFDVDLAGAFVRLKETELKAWVGEYEDRVPIDEDAEENERSQALVKARRVRRLIIAFTGIEAGPPSIRRDLSHTLKLLPTIEDVLTDSH